MLGAGGQTFYLFLGVVSVGSPGWLGTHNVVQVTLECGPPTQGSQVLGLQAWTTMPGSTSLTEPLMVQCLFLITTCLNMLCC